MFGVTPNASKFDTRFLNEDTPQNIKQFIKRNCKFRNVTKVTPRTPQNEEDFEYLYIYTYKSRHNDPHTKLIKYINKIIEPYVSASRFREG